MDLEGFNLLLEKLKDYNKKSILIILESTGIYHINLYSHLNDEGFNVSVVNPLLIYNFNKSITLRKSKTDKIDAYRIACFALHNKNETKHNTTSSISVRSMVRERDKISKEIAKIKTDIQNNLQLLFPELVNNYNVFTKTILSLLLKAPGAYPIKRMKAYQIKRIFDKTKGNKVRISPKKLLDMAKKSFGTEDVYLESVLVLKIEKLIFMQNQKDDMDKKIKKYFKENKQNEIKILTSINGIGESTAEKFIIEIGDINRFESYKKLRAYIGTDPSIKQSGSSINIKGKISKKGNAYLRRTIWQMATSVVRYSDTFAQYFNKKYSERKSYKQAIIAVANKLIKTLYALIKNNSLFYENYKNNSKFIYS